jgi:acetylglutamate kinase
LSANEKAEILIEALPYIKEFYGRLVVIKYGGAAMADCHLKKKVMQDIVLMKYVGMNPVVVHGGGPKINQMLERLNIETSFINGLRVTDRETMEIVEMVLGGTVNKEIVTGIHEAGGKAIGISGKDAGLIRAVPVEPGGRMGFTGEVEVINPEIIYTVIKRGYIPVIAPIGIDADYQSYNINADSVAAAIAIAMEADKLVLLTDVPGLLRDPEDSSSLISVLRCSDIPGYVEQGIISGGMVPKVRCCQQAVQEGVKRTHIIDGRDPHSILLEIFTDEGVGTMVVDE